MQIYYINYSCLPTVSTKTCRAVFSNSRRLSQAEQKFQSTYVHVVSFVAKYGSFITEVHRVCVCVFKRRAYTG